MHKGDASSASSAFATSATSSSYPKGTSSLQGGFFPEPRKSGASTRWLGSPGYAAPEQMVGHPAPSSDIYSLGATMYRLVTNRQPRGESGSPFDMPSASEVTRELGAEAVPEGLSDLIGRCVRLEMSGRFASAGELRAALERELGRTGDFGTKPHAVPVKESAPQAPPGAAVRRQRVWLKSLWARGALVLAVIACGLLVLWGVAGGLPGQKKGVQAPEAQAAAQQLALGALSAVDHETVFFVQDNGRRQPTPNGWRRSRGAQKHEFKHLASLPTLSHRTDTTSTYPAGKPRAPFAARPSFARPPVLG